MTTPNPVTALVTLDDVYDHLNIDNPDGSLDVELMGFIAAAEAYVQFQTGPIVPRTFTEVHSGGGPTIVLDNPPILSITSVFEYVGPTAYPLTQCELGSATGAYAFSLDDASAGVLCRRYNGGLAGGFAGGYRNIQVTYVAGLAAVPGDVRMAVLEDLRGLYSQTQYGGEGVGGGAGSSADQWDSNDRGTPIGAFPRLAALLAGPSRTPSIA